MRSLRQHSGREKSTVYVRFWPIADMVHCNEAVSPAVPAISPMGTCN